MRRVRRNFRLSEEADGALRELAQRLGVTDTAVVEMAVRFLAEEKLPPKTEEPSAKEEKK